MPDDSEDVRHFVQHDVPDPDIEEIEQEELIPGERPRRAASMIPKRNRARLPRKQR